MNRDGKFVSDSEKSTSPMKKSKAQNNSFISRLKDALSESPAKKQKKNKNVDTELADLSGVSRSAVGDIKDLVERAKTLEEAGMIGGAERLKKQALQMKNRYKAK